MPELSLGLAFGAGLLAIVNPCGIGMIPAYLAMQGASGARPSGRRFLSGVVGLVLGFVGIFSAVALGLALFGHVLLQAVPLVAGAIGLGLLGFGLLTLAGRRVRLPVPGFAIRSADSFDGQVLFGATYALASLGCALPVFLSLAAAALSARSPLALAGNVAAFAIGAAVMISALVALGAAGAQLARALPGPLLARYASGTLLSVAGAYLLYLQLGFLIGYPFGIPVVTLPL